MVNKLPRKILFIILKRITSLESSPSMKLLVNSWLSTLLVWIQLVIFAVWPYGSLLNTPKLKRNSKKNLMLTLTTLKMVSLSFLTLMELSKKLNVSMDPLVNYSIVSLLETTCLRTFLSRRELLLSPLPALFTDILNISKTLIPSSLKDGLTKILSLLTLLSPSMLVPETALANILP